MEGAEDQLAQERGAAQFDVEAMKVVWAGSPRHLELSDRIARLVASDPVFRKDNRTMLGRKELFTDTLRKAAHAWKRINELRLNDVCSKALPEGYSLRVPTEDELIQRMALNDQDLLVFGCFFMYDCNVQCTCSHGK